MAAFFQLLIFFGTLAFTIPFLGKAISYIFEPKERPFWLGFGYLERLVYRIVGINSEEEMDWKTYAKAVFVFNGISFLFLFFLLIFQGYLPLNPQNFPAVPWPLAFNIAASFSTNTNWQSYAGETTLSYLSQTVGLTVQNFLSAATGAGIAIVFIRGIVRKTTHFLGNFYVDLTRATLYLLLPLSIILSILLLTQGVIQTFSPYIEATTLEGAKQIIPLGPVASQVAIKQLGTNGGGFFNTNSAHPFENPTGFSNLLQIFAIVWIPAAFVYAFGVLTRSMKSAYVLLGVMCLLFFIGFGVSLYSEHLKNPVLDAYPVLEGKETRFGINQTLLWSVLTTDTANGSVNGMLDSLSPLSGGMTFFNLVLGEIIFGGVGVGLCSMLMFVLLTVFLAGLMVGRTPEYFGKKIEKRDIQWVMVAILFPSAFTLIGSSFAVVLPEALSSLGNQGPHGLTEILYAFASSSANNGSSFAGLNANTDFYNLILGLIMIGSRIAIIIPSLAIAGNLAAKRKHLFP